MRSLRSVTEPEDERMANRVGVQGRVGAGMRRKTAPIVQADRVPDSERLLPVLAGARARGMADALEALGVAALMLDRAGLVLHASSHASRFIGVHAARGLSLTAETLIVADSDANRALQAAIAVAVGEDASEARRIDVPQKGIALTVRPIPCAETDCYQLLRALVIVETTR